MRIVFAIAALVAVSEAQKFAAQEIYGPPPPYSYGYATQDVEGASTAEESTDGSGRVIGKYTLALADGRTRTVSYWADQSGFHADIVTNELGTESKDPADVTIKSSAPTGPEAALAFESTRIRGKASYAAPVFAPAPIAQNFAALRPLHNRFFKA